MSTRALARYTVTLFFSLLACLLILAVAGQATPGKEPAEHPVARVGDQDVTLAELEHFAAAELSELERQRHRLLEQGLTQLVDQRLIEREAVKRGSTVEDFIASEITSQIESVTDADIDSWYSANQQRVRQPKERVTDQIRSFLEHERGTSVRQELLARLRAQHGVKIFFEPLRLDIDLEGAVVKGAEDAPVTLVEFSDFQCPACQRLVPAIHKLSEAYADRLQIAFKQFPLHSIHPNAQKAAEASLCAEEQGKFWEMHDALFERQGELGTEQLKARADELGLDAPKFNDCLDSSHYEKRVTADLESGRLAGVGGTPTLFINGRPVQLLRGSEPFDQLAAIIDDELARSGR